MRRLVGDHRWERLPQRTRTARRDEGQAMIAELVRPARPRAVAGRRHRRAGAGDARRTRCRAPSPRLRRVGRDDRRRRGGGGRRCLALRTEHPSRRRGGGDPRVRGETCADCDSPGWHDRSDERSIRRVQFRTSLHRASRARCGGGRRPRERPGSHRAGPARRGRRGGRPLAAVPRRLGDARRSRTRPDRELRLLPGRVPPGTRRVACRRLAGIGLRAVGGTVQPGFSRAPCADCATAPRRSARATRPSAAPPSSPSSTRRGRGACCETYVEPGEPPKRAERVEAASSGGETSDLFASRAR